MELNEWILKLENKNQVVYTEYVASLFPLYQLGIKFADSRDAAFFALGKSDLDSFAICIMDESELSSAYTAIVEGSMRHRAFPIIVLYHTNKDINVSFLRHYNIPVFDWDETFSAETLKNMDTPFIIKYRLNSFKNKNELMNSTSALYNAINNVMSESDMMIGRNLDFSSLKCKYIDIGQNRYGLFSRYVGMIQCSTNKKILVSDVFDLKLELNIFNCRYITSSFKVILLGKVDFNILKWLEKNNIVLITSNDNRLANAFEQLYNIKRPMILNIPRNKE